jgi:hypothetical protein
MVQRSFGKEDQIICEEQMEIEGQDLRAFTSNQDPELTLSSIMPESLSMHKTNRYGDRGSPCLTPLAGEKKSEASPLIKTEN